MVHRFYGCARRSTWPISGFHSGDLVLSDPSEQSAECRIFYQLPHSFNDRFTAVRIHENCPHRSQLPGVSPRLTRCPQHPKVGIPGTHRNSCQFDGTAESLRMQLFLIQAAAWPYRQRIFRANAIHFLATPAGDIQPLHPRFGQDAKHDPFS